MKIVNTVSSAPAVLPPPTHHTEESLRDRLDLAAPAFESDLARLATLTPGTRAYETLVADILRRAPSQAQINAARDVANILGPYYAKYHADTLAELAMAPLGSAEFARIRNVLLSIKNTANLVVEIVERDEEEAQKMKEWQERLLQESAE